MTPYDLWCHFSNLRDAPPIDEQPSMQTDSWRLLKAASGELHLGASRIGDEGQLVARVTSAIAQIDHSNRTLTTASGRRYVLVGAPEERPLECAAIRNHAAAMGLAGAIDVSDQHWLRMLS